MVISTFAFLGRTNLAVERVKMPKMKTHKGAAKRFHKTASGKIKRQRAFGNHIMTKKTRERKRRLRHADIISKADTRRISRLLPY
jgi:large subunit ribosomal protein L35